MLTQLSDVLDVSRLVFDRHTQNETNGYDADINRKSVVIKYVPYIFQDKYEYRSMCLHKEYKIQLSKRNALS